MYQGTLVTFNYGLRETVLVKADQDLLPKDDLRQFESEFHRQAERQV